MADCLRFHSLIARAATHSRASAKRLDPAWSKCALADRQGGATLARFGQTAGPSLIKFGTREGGREGGRGGEEREGRGGEGRGGEGRAGEGRGGQGRAWQGRAGQGRAGQGRAGQGRAGQGRAGQGRAGQGRAGQGRAGQGRAGQGRAGQGRAGQGRAGQGSEGRGVRGGEGRGEERRGGEGRGGEGTVHTFHKPEPLWPRSLAGHPRSGWPASIIIVYGKQIQHNEFVFHITGLQKRFKLSIGLETAL